MIARVGCVYRHYKGNEYRVVAVARHSEDLSELIVYQDINNPEKIWARSRQMFEETVSQNGRSFPRFQRI